MIRPKRTAQVIPGNHFTGMLQQQNEELKRLFLKFDSESVPA
jgi:hypothetical protein